MFLDKIESMLEDPSVICAIKAEENSVPFVDPTIQKHMLQLSVRMAQGGMLRGVRKVAMRVGLFTVVKKVVSEGSTSKISLRLVFDERVPNRMWRRPPWIGLKEWQGFG
jgi:hypothetical protein